MVCLETVSKQIKWRKENLSRILIQYETGFITYSPFSGEKYFETKEKLLKENPQIFEKNTYGTKPTLIDVEYEQWKNR
jgi:hypothetical protein